VPAEFGPDTTQNYEFGIKGNVLDRLLSFEVSIYRIDWKDIQLTLMDSSQTFSYQANAGEAKSEGIELAIEVRPTAGLSISAWAAWTTAELTEDFPVTSTLIGHRGDSLPFGSPFSGSISVDQDFPIGRGLLGYLGGSLSYVGDRKPGIGSPAQLDR
jgi:outer membrane receptor protein involved in Fe transport